MGGRLRALQPPGEQARAVAGVRFGFTWREYHGPVPLTGGADTEGETVALSQDKVMALLTSVEDL